MDNVKYLENEDIIQGVLAPYVGNGKPVLVMAQGNFCAFCTKAKPDFVEFTNSQNDVVGATIEIDGEKSEKEASKNIGKWDKNYKGVPTYLGFDRNGKYVGTHDGGRDKMSLLGFAKTLL